MKICSVKLIKPGMALAGAGSVVVYLLFLAALIVCGCLVCCLCFVLPYFVSFLVL